MTTLTDASVVGPVLHENVGSTSFSLDSIEIEVETARSCPAVG